MTKGFITIATGKDQYFQLAVNLLRSYRYFAKKPLPFAILCDRENQYTAQFDDVLLFRDGCYQSYLDKIRLGDYLPYDLTIFLDADCLAYGDLNVLFRYFERADDLSCFGRVLPLDDESGWFQYRNLGSLQEKVSYVVGLHGGVLFMRRGERCRQVFDTAAELLPDYDSFHFLGNFQTPADEPLLALSMALHGCHPIPFVPGCLICYWQRKKELRLDIEQGLVQAGDDRAILLHWGTRNTKSELYRSQVDALRRMEKARYSKFWPRLLRRLRRLLTLIKKRELIAHLKARMQKRD